MPDTSWLTARDRIAEFTTLLALITGTLARIGNEVYNLQRPEIGELSEAPTEGVVGSITMPQKRNPERSEHLVDARPRGPRRRRARARRPRRRARARRRGVEDRVGVPAGSVLTPPRSSLALGADLVAGLQVDPERMRANVDAQGGYVPPSR